MKYNTVLIADAPEITLTDEDNAGDVLLKFYKMLGWDGKDNLDPCKIRTTKEIFDRLYDLMFAKCPDAVAVGMTMVNIGPGTEDYIQQGKVHLLEGWTSPAAA